METAGSTPPLTDSQELRRRAFAAFRALMSALAARRPLILFIDDLQWGDLDSGALLADLVRPPHAPRVLLICAYRSEETDTSAFLRTVIPALRSSVDARDIDVGELTPDESVRLALAITRENDSTALARARAIAAESGGSPFFIDGLARGNPVYDQFRDDIATAFPGYTNSNGSTDALPIDTTAQFFRLVSP